MPVITRESPDTADAIALISELEVHLTSLYPAMSRHGFSVAKLLAEDVPFFVLRHEGKPTGCGGVKLFGAEYGEIKRMFVRPQFRGMGFGKMLLSHLEEYAITKGVKILRLETGIYQQEAIALYENMGFRRVSPFGEYIAGSMNLFYEKVINNVS